jgi:phospholipid N-methyltransferase
MTYGTSISDFLHFFRSWISDPRSVSAVAPSGEVLGRLITRDIDPCDSPILELGPGTGVFTKALLGRGLMETELTLIESAPDFARLLQRRFPQSRVLLADASRLSTLDLFPPASIGAVVSGLPLLSMSRRTVISVLRGAFLYIRPGGAFYQFTYGFRCPVPHAVLARLGLKATRIGQTVRNLPPAVVYRITRQSVN